MIPGYRLRFYCFLGALFCLGCSWMMVQQLSDALSLWQYDALTGPRRQRVREHLIFNDQPWRFVWYVLKDLVICTGFGSAGLIMSWIVLRGRRAFKRWPEGM